LSPQHWSDARSVPAADISNRLGCRLVLRPDHTLGHLDPATAELITTLSRR
jgi:hypothetical protein